MAPFAEIPKKIHSLWLQGASAAPDLVRVNLERWATLNPAYSFHVLDEADVRYLLKDTGLPLESLQPQALSDIVRARLLTASGGIWVDASLFPVKPIDDWLPQLLQKTTFFAFDRPARDRVIASWFLAASHKNQIMEQWWSEILRFWSRPRRLMEGIPPDTLQSVSEGDMSNEYSYYWFHYLFQYMLKQHPTLAAQWSDCAKYPGKEAHRLERVFVKTALPSHSAIRQALQRAPVQKLNWRKAYPIDLIVSLC